MTQSVGSLWYAKELNSKNIPLFIHIKIDTGMSRNGFYCHSEDDVNFVIKEIKNAINQSNLKTSGIFTHFSEAENEVDDFTQKQFSIFLNITDKLLYEGIDIGFRHCCNSAAMIKYPQMHLDIVRPGITLYGLPPFETSLPFKPTMELKSVIKQIGIFKPGDLVGYGKTYKVKENSKIATIAIGYANGYFRFFSNKDSVLIKGKRAPVVGRISMDTCMIDVTGIDALINDFVTIFGEDEGRYKSVKEMANLFGSISYEILCAIGNRVERIYTQ